MMCVILLVDDDIVLLRCLAELLEKSRCQVLVRSRAEEALADVKAGMQVDLVITDVRMKGMDGIEFLHRLRFVRPDVPAIVLTAYGTLDGYLKAKGLGAVQFLQKPVRARDLLATVEASLTDRTALPGTVDRVAAMIMERDGLPT